MKLISLSLAFAFFAGTIGSDVCFGQLLKRGYLVAREDWRREGSPTWWTWRPSEMAAPQWYYNAPRWRWLLSLPHYLRTDHVARRLHLGHRFLSLLAIFAWGSLLILGIAGYFSR